VRHWLTWSFKLAGNVLIVSVLQRGQETEAHTRPMGDGFITKTGTFQKFAGIGHKKTGDSSLPHCSRRGVAPGL
jgi:hypothetical protein